MTHDAPDQPTRVRFVRDTVMLRTGPEIQFIGEFEGGGRLEGPPATTEDAARANLVRMLERQFPDGWEEETPGRYVWPQPSN